MPSLSPGQYTRCLPRIGWISPARYETICFIITYIRVRSPAKIGPGCGKAIRCNLPDAASIMGRGRMAGNMELALPRPRPKG
jgi:hypothetical protein